MQNVRNTLRIDGAEAKITDTYGGDARTPVLVIGTRPLLEFDLRTTAVDPATGELVPYPFASFADIGSYYFALDGDWDQDTAPKMLALTGISVAQVDGKTILTAQLPNTDNAAVRAALDKTKTVTLQAEIGGFDTTPECAFAWQFDLAIRNRVYIAGDPPAEEETSDYYTKVETEAAISRQLVFEFAEAAEGPWHSPMVAGTDLYLRVRHGATGVASEPIAIPYGPAGEDGDDGDNGVTFMPSIIDGVLSWSNDGGLANPDPVDLSSYLLTVEQKAALTGGPESNADAQHTHTSLAQAIVDLAEDVAALPGTYDDGSVIYSPTGTVVAGKIYRQGVGAWVLADPDDPLCETYELFVALGTDAATDGMARRRTVSGAPSGANGLLLWLADNGGQTDTKPTSATHAGRVARAVGYVRDSETWEFDGHLPGMSFEETAS